MRANSRTLRNCHADHLPPEISKSPASKVPPELAKHEAAQHKVSRDMKRKPDDVG